MNSAVLTALMQRVLSGDVIERVVTEATRRLSGSNADEHRIAAEVRNLEQKAARVADAIEAGGESRTLTNRLSELERRITELTAYRDRMTAATVPDAGHLRRILTAKMEEWRTLLRAEPDAGRRVLKMLIDGRLTFTPKRDEEGEFYEVTGLATLPQMVAGKTLVNVASPAGFGGPWSVESVRILRAA